MVARSYLRHGGTEAWGVIASSSSNSVYDGKRAYVPALEDVLVWDLKTGSQHAMWHASGQRSLVTALSRAPDWDTFAVGYADGSIRLWSAKEKEVLVTLNGHKSAVTTLAWDKEGTVLASGSKDTDIIVWDVVAEVGLFRLRGHRDQITGLAFVHSTIPTTTTDDDNDDEVTNDAETTSSSKATHLISSSKDTFIKLFALDTQHCLDTVVGHRGGVWSLALDASASVLVSGGSDGDVKCWKIDGDVLKSGVLPVAGNGEEGGRGGKSGLRRALTPLAPLSLAHTSHSHTVGQIVMHPTMPVVAVHSGEKTVDVFRLRTEEELRKKQARRRRREREKKKAAGKGKGKEVAEEDDDDDEEGDVEAGGDEKVEWSDRLALWAVVRAGGKIRSFAFAPETAKTKGDVQILTALANNSLEVHNLPPSLGSKAPPPEVAKLFTLDIPGHRADVRALAVSSDDVLIASAAAGTLKIWNRETMQCVRTMECGYALCCTFLPGDKHIVVGTKAGELLLYDLSSSSLLETFEAHTGPLWSLHVRPDSRGLVTGSADKDIKFWDFEAKVAPASEGGAKTLTLAHTKTLKMTDDVLAVKYSPDGNLLAVSLLDSTVKVFYADTLKFFLSLYGHKLPVLALDISSDSKLIVTCSADKNIKIWGLDFGDCHRSLFAHDESVMQVAFERGTHFFWSVGKDKLVKYWDGDKFECIQKLEGHHGEIWAMAVSHRGNFVVTGSHDKSIRLWEKTDEPLFLEEERERELEELYDSNVNARDKDDLRVTGPNGEDIGPESTDVTKSTTETLMAGERIIEALELSVHDRELTLAHERELQPLTEAARKKVAAPPRNPVFKMYGGVGPEEYVLKVVRQIPAASLHDALLVLPFARVSQLIEHLDYWAHQEWQITLTSRVLFFLLRTHHSQIVATRALRTTMLSLRSNLREALRRQKDAVGYNLAALRFIQRQHAAAKSAEFYEQAGVMGDEEKIREKIAQGIKKRKRATMKS